MPQASRSSRGRVALFVTCLVDVFRPRVGWAAARLLEQAGFEVEVPRQTCCGQPNHSAGDERGAREIAARLVSLLAGYDYVVVPSGSCAAMLKVEYPRLHGPGSPERDAALELAGRTYELASFLHEVAELRELPARLEARVAYHDACTGLRTLGVREQPRALLRAVAGLELVELDQGETCCGFGGAFCVRYPAIADAIAQRKLDAIEASGATALAAGDLGCLLHLEGKLHRAGSAVRALHIAEILAGELDEGVDGGA